MWNNSRVFSTLTLLVVCKMTIIFPIAPADHLLSRGVVQILNYYSHIYIYRSVLGILYGRVFLYVLYISCYNLSMLTDILHIFQIHYNQNHFNVWSKVYLFCFVL